MEAKGSGENRNISPCSEQEKGYLKRTLVTVGILVVASFGVVDVVGDILGEDNVLAGKLTWSLIIQVVILGVALVRLWGVMDLSRRWTAEILTNLLSKRIGPDKEEALGKASDYIVRLGYLVVLYLLAVPPLSTLVGAKVMKLVRLGIVFLGLFLGYGLWRSLDEILKGAPPTGSKEG